MARQKVRLRRRLVNRQTFIDRLRFPLNYLLGLPFYPKCTTMTAIWWARYDLRLHDNEALLRAIAHGDRTLCVYCVDPAHYRMLPVGCRKTGVLRAQFLKESLEDLRNSLTAIGGQLLIVHAAPEAAIPRLAEVYAADTVFVQEEIGTEERRVEVAVEHALHQRGKRLERTWGRTLYHIEDAPFAPDEAPETAKALRNQLQKGAAIRELLPTPMHMRGVDGVPSTDFPSWEAIGFTAPELDEVTYPAYPGGERAALDRLEYYIFGTQLIERYGYTRNQSLGPDYSSKFSAYLAHGCLSPRRAYRAIKEYEQLQKRSRSTWKLGFELMWREYFQYQGLKHGRRMFFIGGTKNKEAEWQQDKATFERWCRGKTGIPFVDAHMRELLQTGFMSNRGRVNTASFFTRDLQIDWRWGAAWFESRLLDYDVASNWLNWNTQALHLYYTNPVHQGMKYDEGGQYVHYWLPELRDVPAPLVHAVFTLSGNEQEQYGVRLHKDYPAAIVQPDKWNRAISRIRKAAEKMS